MTWAFDRLYVEAVLGLRQRAVAFGLISLELVLVGHMAFERHTVSTSGDVVELHASSSLHGHEERSLCERDAADGDDSLDTLCHLAPEHAPSAGRGPRVPDASLEARRAASVTRAHVHQRLWLMAPKASPPASC